MIATSGSTGAPKRVVLSRDAMRASALATHERLGGPGQWVLNLPPTYVAGVQVLYRSVVAGTEPVFDDRRDARPVRRRLHLAGADPAVSALLRDGSTPQDADAGFDAVLVGGGPLAPERARPRPRRDGIRIVQTYGMSETCGGCVYDGGRSTASRSGSATTARCCCAGRCCSTATRASPSGPRRSLPDGWFHTDDLGRIDDDGRLRVTGRADDVIISGGVKVPAAAVAADDRRSTRRPCARRGASACPTTEWGERVVAVVGAPTTRSRSTRVARPGRRRGSGRRASSCSVEEIPLLPNGKPDRVALQGAGAVAERSSRSRCAPASAASPCARACWSRARRAGASSARSWSTTPPPRRPGWTARARRPTSAGPTRVRDSIPVNVTVPACDPERAREIVLASAGCRTAKVKVAEPGQEPGEDEARLEAVRDALGADGLVRIDANGGWSVDEAVRADRRAGAGRRRAGVRRAAGRLGRGPGRRTPAGGRCRSPPTSRSAARPTPTACATSRRPTSPYSRCSRSAASAPACGSPRTSACRSSSRARSSPASASRPGSRSPRRCPSCRYACGLATVQLLTDDVVAEPLLPVDGALPVRRPAVDAGAARGAGRLARTGWSTGGAGWPRSRPCGRIVVRDAPPPDPAPSTRWPPGWSTSSSRAG